MGNAHLRSILFLLFLGTKSLLSLERADRLLINSDPQAFQEQISHLTQELNTLYSEINDLRTQVATQNKVISSSRGSTFIIWGKNSCPAVNGTEKVYNGVAGGGQYNEDGNGANTLCLPHDPEHPPFSISVAEGDDYAHLYGSEYRLNLHRVHSPEDVPCAVCRTHLASSTIMVPGKHTCPVKWQKQYSGLLTASRHVYQKSEYLCLHEDPDFLEGSRNKDDGRLFYPVKSVCGSLPCPPYEDDMLVSCVVCSG
ncbi:uncharacterized protein LOC111109364 [Crassostrea virginica]